MTTDRFPNGTIVSYPYLWRWQAAEGREHGEKDRPVCLALTVPDPRQNITHLVILPISGTPPRSDQTVLEIPDLELRRAGLSVFKRGWITVSEYNYDIAERSWFFDTAQSPRGRFGPRFLEDIRQALRPVLAAHAGRIDRTR
ncbi:hypothetical protein [Rhizobium sp. L43]|uniref:hypothetical protein n=1 Tax=Rhizobium sp. L43 TaxID=2035452 RepID=UPI000BEA95E9|nr:hypothetical protein [Rhizobium sp. L43]PDS78716.1 hypothetical protein CO667_10690 [Rhizobium sp. L43]